MVSEVAALLNKHCRTANPATRSRPAAPTPAPVRPTFAPPVAFAASVVIPQGDGSVKVIPGKPVAWLSPTQFAREFGLDRSTIYRAVREGTIPPEFVEPIGKRKLRISAAAVEHVRATWRARWGDR